ncbi:alpha-galactosidase [Crossiella equi]|uniref:Alpha-galactosidase n=1 Tax=Crossiella equi TaxID=130796 RepID=A0ABS5ACR7_9PSEU|nr:NPCBM/NEW2 domain-containing protein [Crossiella equi]MBP2474382.1 alpha-galactosidase [Crossiella equi]
MSPLSRLGLALSAALLAAAAGTPALAVPPPPSPAPTPRADDGLALTPPMGFNNWNTTHCRAEFNEKMITDMADIFVSKGLKAAGYSYVNIDDCWALPRRDAAGDLVPDPVRFPRGIRWLADYVHAKGLKFGIYTSAGTKTCNKAGGFPGALGFEDRDARLFASWGVDYLKYDNCNNQGVDAKLRYTRMRDALKRTGRPIVFSICEWGQNKPWEWAGDLGHLWRTTGDINDTWAKTVDLLKRNMVLADYAGPGRWNDPDMLEVGNGKQTTTEYRSQFALWSTMAAPLLIGADLRQVSPEHLAILTNKDIIAVNQDKLGKQGRPVRVENGRYVFVKPLAGGDRAVALFNETDLPQRITTTVAEAGLPKAPGYTVRDLWTGKSTHTAGGLAAVVPPHGTAIFRVAADRTWPQHPPAVDSSTELALPYPDATPVLAPGKAAELTTSVHNAGRLPAPSAQASLTAPPGWTVRAHGPDRTPVLPGESTWRRSYTLTPPAGTTPGTYTLTSTVTFDRPARTQTQTLELLVPEPPPAGTVQLSAVRWLRATNGHGPVERDTSNGESKPGDGRPLTIGGTVFPRGLGVHAPSTVEYHLGGRCTTVSAQVGVDDEKNAGSVVFQVFADAAKVADSGVLTAADAAKPLRVNVSGASALRLVVTDGGDGQSNDHADWADVRLSCH